ncbi:MAG: glycosyltransferase family 4 protein [Ignavibacteriae bacterium]|nr:glycosyltransferase family 4 protein [Ignavibacteriota bacterium]
MNIILLTSDFFPNVGGMATHAYELARAHAANGHTVNLVVPVYGTGENHREEMDGFTVHRLFITNTTPRVKHVIYIRMVRSYILALMSQMKVDVLHWHDLTPNCWSTWTLRSRLPLVWTNHTSNYLEYCETPRGRAKIRAYLHHPQAIISPSRELHEKSARTGVRSDRLYYIPNGVDAAKFKPGLSFGVLDKDFGIDLTRPVIVCPRRLEPKNGVEYLIRAVPLIRERVPGAQILIVGGGFPEERERFEVMLSDAGHREGVFFTGNVPNQSMPGFYALSTVAVLPSLMEATSISGLESMASGLPLVGTNVGGIPELIIPGESGLLVEARDPRALADALIRVLTEPSLRESLGRGARARVEQVFAWPEIARRTADVYLTAQSDWHSNHGGSAG